MRFFLIVVLALFNMTGIAMANDAPFGLNWGMTEEELKDKGVQLVLLEEDSHFKHFKTESLPQNISIAEAYSISLSKNYGLQHVSMVYRISDDVYGRDGKKLYDRIKESLIEKYGSPTFTYEKIGLKLYDESDEFYQCLAYTGCGGWISVYELKNKVNIGLRLTGSGRGKGALGLIYEGPNWTDAKEEQTQEKIKTDSGAL